MPDPSNKESNITSVHVAVAVTLRESVRKAIKHSCLKLACASMYVYLSINAESPTLIALVGDLSTVPESCPVSTVCIYTSEPASPVDIPDLIYRSPPAVLVSPDFAPLP